MAKKLDEKTTKALKERRKRPLATPTDLASAATRDISAALNQILADVFALYLKTKNFHWHVSGPHFRDYHLLLDEQGDQLFAMTDPIAERIRKIGGTKLREDNKVLAAALREAHNITDEHRDIASSSLIENWIDETERRTWFLFEASREGDSTGH
jgi:starvation-inducible DNA-binding protein